MFEIGIKEVDKKISEIRREFEDFESKYGKQGITVKLNLQGATAEVENLVAALKGIGDIQKIKEYENQVKQLKAQIDQLQTSVATMGGKEAESSDKAVASTNRYLKILADVENKIADIKNINAKGEGLRIDMSAINAAERSFMAFYQRLTNIESLDNGMISAFAAEFAKLKAQYSPVINEAKKFNTETERTVTLLEKFSLPKTQVSVVSSQDTEEIRKQIEAIGALYMRIKELQGIKIDNPKSWDNLLWGGNWNKYSGSYQEQMEVFRSTLLSVQKELNDMSSRGLDISGYQKQLNALFETFEKFSALQPIDISKKLGLEHLKGYTGPVTAADDVMWASMKKQAEVQEVAHAAADKHRRKLEELTNAFAQHDAQVAKSNRIQENFNQSRQEATALLRKQSESLVKSRLDVLRGQEEQLKKLQASGRDALGAEQYEAVRNALRNVREEMRQIETVMQRMSSYSVTNLFSIGRGQMDYTPTIVHANQVLKENTENKTRNTAATSQLSAEEQKLASSITRSTSEMGKQSQVLGDLKSMAFQYLSVWGAQNFLDNIIQIGGQLEQQRLSIGAILGDLAAGQHLFDQIKALALTSPFGVMELDKDTKQLAAYGFKQSELYDMTKRLADISAGAGTEVSRLALALGHVRSEGALSGYTLRQFAMNNIPMLGKLSERLTELEGKIVSTQEIRKRISKKEIGYEDVIAVIKDLTNEAGMFYNMQETMAQAVNAKFKNLHDSFDIMYSEIAESKIGDALKVIAESLMTLSRNWETTGRFIGYAALAWVGYRTAVMGANLGLARFGVESSRSLMMLNAKKIALGLNSASVKKLTADEIDEMVTLKLLTKEQLLNAVASGRLTVAQTELAAATFGVSGAQLASIASMGRSGIMMSGLALRMRSLAVSIRGIGVAIKSAFLNPVTIAIVAITSLFEWYMRWKQHNEELRESITNLEMKSSEGYRNLADAVSKFNKVGKMDETGYITAINDIVDTLKNYAPDINNILKEAYAISDLRERYEYLRKQLVETKEAYASLEKVAGAAVYAADNSDLPDKVEDYIESIKKQMKAEQEFYQHRATIEKALEELSKKSGSFNKARVNSNGDVKTLSEQMELVRGNEGWSKLFSSYLYTESLRAADAWSKFNGKLQESDEILRNSVTPAINAFADSINNEYIGKFGNEWYKNGALVKVAWMEVKDEIDRIPGMTENVRNELLDKVFNERWKLNIDFNTGEVEETLVGWRKEMQDYFDENHILLKIGVNDKPEDIEKRLKGIKDEAQSAVDRYGKVLIGIGFKLDNLPSSLPAPLATPWNQNALDNYPEQKSIVDAANAAAKKFSFNLEGKTRSTKKKTGSGGSKEDKNAKAVRERVRIMKEAADAYEYWRKKVGERGAWSHVMDEFGDVLSKIGITADNVQDLKTNLDSVLSSKEFKAIKDKKVKLEVEKEIAKEQSQLNRKDFEETADEFASKVQIELDSLTRAWEIFNNVRNATGDVELAIRLSGADYSGNKTRNLADALLDKLKKDFAGMDMRFDIGLSDKEIEDMVQAAVPKESEESIKGLVEEYKKWRDLQRDVLKNDIDVFTKLIGSSEGYANQIKKINDEYEEQLTALNKLREKGSISEEEYNSATGILQTQTDQSIWERDTMYINLMNNSLSMTRNEIEFAAQAQENMLNRRLRDGLITAKEYTDEMKNLHNIMQGWENDGFLGMKGSAGAFLGGGNNGLLQYYLNRANKARTEYANAADQDSEYAQGKKKEAEHYEELYKALAKLTDEAGKIVNAFQTLQSGIELIGNFFDAAGMEGAANSTSAVGGILSGALGGASSLSSLGPWGMAAGAALGVATAMFQQHDKDIQREIDAINNEVKALDQNTEAIKRSRERTLGYDTGLLRRQMQGLYSDLSVTRTKKIGSFEWSWTEDSAAKKAMREYYGTNTSGTGYSQELSNLKKQREDYIKMYDLENDKKKKSQDSLMEYKSKIAELDDQIAYFAQDLAQEMFGIDLKGWADEIGDALMNAFENGEDAAEAFKDTVQGIMRKVLRQMLSIGIIQPMMEKLQKKLFGTNGKGGSFDAMNPEGTIDNAMRDVAEFFSPNGEGYAMINATQTFYEKWEEYMRSQGMTLSSSEKSSSSASNSIKSISEQTADLLASYLNSTRADVSVQRALLDEYMPMFFNAMTQGNASLRNLESRAQEISISNAAIERNTAEVVSLMNGLRFGTWRLPMS